MIPHGPIDSYLKQLGEGLRLPTWERARVLEEARDHLEQATTSFPCAAHDRTKAESRAVEAFGTVREVSDRFHLESTTLGKIEMIRILIKPAISAIMLFTFAFAVLYGGFNRLRAAGRTREGRFFDRDRHCYHVCERRSAVPPLDAQRKPASNRRGGVSRVSRSDGYWRMDRVIDVLQMGASNGNYEFSLLGWGLALVAQAATAVFFAFVGDTRTPVGS